MLDGPTLQSPRLTLQLLLLLAVRKHSAQIVIYVAGTIAGGGSAITTSVMETFTRPAGTGVAGCGGVAATSVIVASALSASTGVSRYCTEDTVLMRRCTNIINLLNTLVPAAPWPRNSFSSEFSSLAGLQLPGTKAVCPFSSSSSTPSSALVMISGESPSSWSVVRASLQCLVYRAARFVAHGSGISNSFGAATIPTESTTTFIAAHLLGGVSPLILALSMAWRRTLVASATPTNV